MLNYLNISPNLDRLLCQLLLYVFQKNLFELFAQLTFVQNGRVLHSLKRLTQWSIPDVYRYLWLNGQLIQ